MKPKRLRSCIFLDFIFVFFGIFFFLSSVYAADYTWTGAVSSDWNTAGNWSGSVVPTSADNVTIPDTSTTVNDPAVSSGAVAANVTVNANGILNGNGQTLTVYGNWTNSGAFNHGNGSVAMGGTTAATFTPGSSEYYNLELNKTSTSSTYDRLNIVNTVIVAGNLIQTNGRLLGGQINLNGNYTIGASASGSYGSTAATIINFNSSTIDQSITYNAGGVGAQVRVNKAGGTFIVSSDITIDGFIYISGSVSGMDNHILTFGGEGIGNFTPGNLTYSGININKTIASTSYDRINISGTVNLAGDLIHTNGRMLGGQIDLKGGYIVGASANGSYGGSAATIVNFNNPSSDQSIIYSAGGIGSHIQVNKLAGTFIMDSDITVSGWTYVAGNVSGVDNHTITFGDEGIGTFVPGALLYGGIVINKTSASTSYDYLTLSSGPLNISGNLALTDGRFLLNSSNADINLSGNVTIGAAGAFTKGTGTLNFNGTAPSVYTDQSGALQNIGKVVVNKTNVDETQNKLTLASSLICDIMTIDGTAGQKDTLDIGNSDYVLTLANAGNVADIFILNGSLSVGNSKIKYIATNSAGNINIIPAAFNSLELAGSETYVLSGDTLVEKNLTIGASSILDTASYDLNINGNFANSGNFIPNTNTVTLGGTNQGITGNISFYNLVKQVTFADTLTFAASSTATILSGGNLVLQGNASALLALRSSVTGTTWNLSANESSTYSFDYLDVQDSNAADKALTTYNSTDSGNNTNWTISSQPFVNVAPSATAPILAQTIDGTGHISVQTSLDDANHDDTLRLKVEYSVDNGSTWHKPYLTSYVLTGSGQTPLPDVDNNQEYQIGVVNRIQTSSGINAITFKWDTKSPLNELGAIISSAQVKIRITPDDGMITGSSVVNDIAFTVDNAVTVTGDITVCASGCGYATIQEAINGATVGNVILVGAGTYTEQVNITKSVNIIGHSDADTLLIGGFNVSANGVVISGFDISGGYTWQGTVSASDGIYKAGIYAASSNNYFGSNVVHDITGGNGADIATIPVIAQGPVGGMATGIFIYGGSTNNTIASNIISGITGGNGGNFTYSGTSGWGGTTGYGGNAVGVYIGSAANSNIVSTNEVYSLTGGIGGDAHVATSVYTGWGTSGAGGKAIGIQIDGAASNMILSNNVHNLTGGKSGAGYVWEAVGTGGVAVGVLLRGTGNNLASNVFASFAGGSGKNNKYASYQPNACQHGADGTSTAIWIYDISSYNNSVTFFIQSGAQWIADSSKLNTIDGSPIFYAYNKSDLYISDITVNTGTAPLSVGGEIYSGIPASVPASKASGLGADAGVTAGMMFIDVSNSQISGNALSGYENLPAGTGSRFDNGGDGGYLAGIYTKGGSNLSISSNTISNLSGAESATGGLHGSGGAGTVVAGIYMSAIANSTIDGNTISSITGGRGGIGGNDGSGGTGGLGAGVILESSTGNVFESNLFSEINGGLGGLLGDIDGNVPGSDNVGSGIWIKDDTSLDNTLTSFIAEEATNIPDASKLNKINGAPIIYLNGVSNIFLSSLDVSTTASPIIVGGSFKTGEYDSRCITGEVRAIGGNGGTSYGMYINNSSNVAIANVTISGFQAMAGGSGGYGGRQETPLSSGGTGGDVKGIYVQGSTAIQVNGAAISGLTGGKGGGTVELSVSGPSGFGGNVYGMYFTSSSVAFSDSAISALTGGASGNIEGGDNNAYYGTTGSVTDVYDDSGNPIISTPAFSLAGGIYTSSQTVSISCATDGAVIYYTIDGSNPTISSSVYSSSLVVSSTATIKAIAVKSGYSNSAVGSVTYEIRTVIGMPDRFQKSSRSICSGCDGGTKIAFRIVFDRSLTVTHLGFHPYAGTGDGRYVAELVNDESGLPGTTVYASTGEFGVVDSGLTHSSTTNGWETEVPVTSPYTPTAGATYWMVYTWVSGTTGFGLGDLSGFNSADFDTRYTTRFWNGSVWEDQGFYGVAWVLTTDTGADHVYGQLKLRRDMSAFVGDQSAANGGRMLGQIATVDSNKVYQLDSFNYYLWSPSTVSPDDLVLTIQDYNTNAILWSGSIGKPGSGQNLDYYFSDPKPVISNVSKIRFFLSAASPEYQANSIEFYDNAHSWGATDDTSIIKDSLGNWVTLPNFDMQANLLATDITNSSIVATPSFSPIGGTYASIQTVALSSATAGAAIYYTLDGSDPTVSSNLYSTPLTISSDTIVKALAVKTGYNDSAVAIASYVISIPAVYDYYVSTVGNDANDGLTPETAWRTITYAATQIKAGDTVNVAAGNYGSEKITINVDGTAEKPVTFRTYNGSVNLTGDGIGIALSISSDYVTVDGDFVMDNYNRGVYALAVNHVLIKWVTTKNMIKTLSEEMGDGIVTAGGSSYVTIDGCTVTNVQAHGIFSFGSPYDSAIQDNIIIRNCTINGTNHNGIDIHSNNQNILVENNNITDAEGSAAIYSHNSYSTNILSRNKNITIRNNTIDQLGTTGGNRGIWIISTDGALVEGNNISNCHSYGIMVDSEHGEVPYSWLGNVNIVIQNNTFSGTEDYGDIMLYSTINDTTSPNPMDNIVIKDNNFSANNSIYVWGVDNIANGIHFQDIARPFRIVFSSQASNSFVEYTNGTAFAETTTADTAFTAEKSSLSVSALNGTYVFTPYPLTVKPDSGTATVTVNAFDTTSSLPVGTVLTDFTADTSEGGNVTFMVSTLKSGVNYLVKKDGTEFTTVPADAYGKITFSNSSWSVHEFTVEETVTSTPLVTAPTFSLPSGTYASSQTITLSSATPGTTIYYTLDGSTPTVSSQLYTSPISVSASTTIKALAVKEGYLDSAVSTAIYTITALSSDSNLSSLTLSSGTFSPAFSPSTTSYSTSVLNSVSSITLTPTVNEIHASMRVNNTEVNSGAVSSSLSLNVGTNTITIVVTAQDGTTKAYTLTVNREAASGGSGSGGSGGSGGSSTHPKPKPREIKITGVVGNNVNLSLAVDGASQMMLADNSSFTNTSWETYQTTKTYTKKDTQTKLYLRFKSSYNILSDIVTLDIPVSGGNTSSYPTGALLKTPSSFKIYVMIEGKKKWIPTPEVFEQLGYKWTEIKTLTDTELNALPDYEDNLIRTIGDYKVYLVVNGVKRHIPDPEVFLNYGFSWDEVKDVDKSIVDKYKDTYLLKQSGSDGIYYVNSQGVRKLIPSDSVFKSYGDRYEEVQIISGYEMGKYPLSNLIKPSGTGDIYLIGGNIKKHILSSEVFNKYRLNWNLVMNVNQTEFNFYQDGGELR